MVLARATGRSIKPQISTARGQGRVPQSAGAPFARFELIGIGRDRSGPSWTVQASLTPWGSRKPATVDMTVTSLFGEVKSMTGTLRTGERVKESALSVEQQRNVLLALKLFAKENPRHPRAQEIELMMASRPQR